MYMAYKCHNKKRLKVKKKCAWPMSAIEKKKKKERRPMCAIDQDAL